MAPSLEDPIQVIFTAPLKVAPKLVAPEPGKPPLRPSTPSQRLNQTYSSPQNIVLDLNPIRPANPMPAPAALIKLSAPPPQKAPTPIFPS